MYTHSDTRFLLSLNKKRLQKQQCIITTVRYQEEEKTAPRVENTKIRSLIVSFITLIFTNEKKNILLY